MIEHPYTLAMYKVKPGFEQEFIKRWDDLAKTFVGLSHPPLWGTLIQHAADHTVFYSFGPWRAEADVRAMRENRAAKEAFANLAEVCEQLTPGDYTCVRHVDVSEAAGPM